MLIKFTDDKRCSGIAKRHTQKFTKVTDIREGPAFEGSRLLDQMAKRIGEKEMDS